MNKLMLALFSAPCSASRRKGDGLRGQRLALALGART